MKPTWHTKPSSRMAAIDSHVDAARSGSRRILVLSVAVIGPEPMTLRSSTRALLLQYISMSVSPLYQLKVRTASDLSDAIERLIAGGRLPIGGRLPAVRELATALSLSPTTVAAAYRTLGQRGLVRGAGRRGTLVAASPALPIAAERPPPPGV